MSEKTKVTKEDFNNLVEKNFTSGMVMMVIDQLEFLRGVYKMKEKQILNNTLNQFSKMLKSADFDKDQKEHLQSRSDALHNEVYNVKQEYRKQISKHFEVV